MKLFIQAISDIGCVRPQNEDMILVGKQLIRNGQSEYELENEPSSFFVAVADGMGGHAAGEIASEFILQRFSSINLPINLDKNKLQAEIEKNVNDINISLNELGITTHHTGLGTTFCGLLFYGNQCFFINIGDSRLYRLRGKFLTQLTRDHSLSSALDNPSVPNNLIMNAFGGNTENIFIDFEETLVLENDKFLLCTDGLTNDIEDETIEAILLEHDNLEYLLNYAKKRGGSDNISYAIITRLTENLTLKNV